MTSISPDRRRARRWPGPFSALVALTAAGSVSLLTGCGADPGRVAEESAKSLFRQNLHDRLPPDVRAAGVLRVGTDASYAPASFFAPDGRTIIGFEPDLAAAMAEVLGVRFKMVNIDFTEALSLVADHRVDAVMSAMTDTAERQEQVDFVDYFSAGTAIVVQRGNPQGISQLDDLCGQVVAVEDGTVQVDMLARAQPGCTGMPITVTTYPTNSDALVQLRTGRAAAVLNDYPPAVYLTTDARTRSHFQLASTAQYEPGPYGIAVAKDRAQLRDVLYDTMTQLMRTGVYTEVLRRWSVTDGAVPEVTINAGAATAPGPG